MLDCEPPYSTPALAPSHLLVPGGHVGCTPATLLYSCLQEEEAVVVVGNSSILSVLRQRTSLAAPHSCSSENPLKPQPPSTHPLAL